MNFEDTLKPYLNDEEISSLVNSFNGTDTHAVILNTNKIDDSFLTKTHKHLKKHPFVKHAYIFDKSENELGKEVAYDQGLYSIQDPSAMMPVYFLNPQPNEIVLDMCASPGGKSIQCSLLMKDTGILIANDISYPRAKDLSQNIERMGLGNVIVASTDFSIAYPHFLEKFDRILLDAPCSGSAMFRKNPASKQDWSIKKVENCAKIQADLIQIAYKMLKPGGVICYSTCSFSYEEDEQIVLNFIKNNHEAELIKLEKDKSFTRSVQLPEAVHILPTHFEGEGQFMCLIKKPGKLTPNTFTKSTVKKYNEIINAYDLQDRSNELINGSLYSLTSHFDIGHLNVLRYGVRVCDIDDKLAPHHSLSHFISSNCSIELDDVLLKKYLHGETFSITHEDGFYPVCYQKINVGFVKVTKGIAKNHYPKGLRRN